MNKMS